MKSGDVLAWRGTGFVSSFIEHWTASEYSHVGLIWVPESAELAGRVLVLEAREAQNFGPGWGSVQLVAASQAIRRAPCDWVRTALTWSPTMAVSAVENLGKPYSYLAAVEAGLNIASSDQSVICSKYIADIFGISGRGMTPKALVSRLRDDGATLQSIEIEA